MASSVIASSPGECCFTGVKHSGDPAGHVINIGGIETYISEPKAESGTKKIILFFADVYGPLHINNQLLQDYFASQGFIVLGIEYFFGDPIFKHLDDPEFDKGTWITKARERAVKETPGWIEAVKEKYGTTDVKYNAVGYCFGGPFPLELATTDLLTAAAFAHPAFLNEEHFKHIKKPLYLGCAETDHTFGLEGRRRAEDILREIQADYHIQVFSGVAHGFGPRGDPKVENSRWAKDECARGIANWFERWSSL